jgi:ribose-phosphate pyrophosphokinase
MIIVPGPASHELGLKVAELLGAKIMPIEYKSFPDGESYIRFTGDVKGAHVVIIQTISPPQDTHLVQALLMADAAKDLGAKKIILVAPYFAYTRQDRRFLEGEAVSLQTVVRLLIATGVKGLITINSHSPNLLEKTGIKVRNLSAIGLLAEYFKAQGLSGAISLAPGKRAAVMAVEAERILKGGCDFLKTRRDLVTGKAVVEVGKLGVKDRDAIIFDDIISTGGTMAEAVRIVKELGARRVYAACVHPLLIGGAGEKILKNGAEKIVGTDTVPSPIGAISVAPLIADALRRRL